jgi:purine-binding chemotaxis protein CheW
VQTLTQPQPLIEQPQALASDEAAARPIHVCTFRLGEALYGVVIAAVKEVNILPPLTPIPHAPNSVCGYVNLRGQILLCLDLKQMLGLGPSTITAQTRLVVFQASLGEPFGVLVDQIGDIVQVQANQLEPRPTDSDQADPSQLLVGVAKLEDELLLLVNPRKLLPLVEQATR